MLDPSESLGYLFTVQLFPVEGAAPGQSLEHGVNP